MFTIGIGPSSSHTVGPMRAARRFAVKLADLGLLDRTATVFAELFGSLGLTGRGHGSDKAVLLGLEGETPEEIDPEQVDSRLAAIRSEKRLNLLGRNSIHFDEKAHLDFHRRQTLPLHSNGMRFTAKDAADGDLLTAVYYSIGGGFVIAPDEAGQPSIRATVQQVPYPFGSAKELLALCRAHDLSIGQLTFENEKSLRPETEVRAGVRKIWQAMQDCVARGCRIEGVLPGGLKVKRRAPGLYRDLTLRAEKALCDPLTVLDFVNLYALAVNEENAAGGRVVTAPTNGAAGIIPAVLHYYERFCPNANEEGVLRFLLTASAIGMLYKQNASISGAEVGCQGEVGVACSMAAAGLAEALGGGIEQVENAAEIGMEHNLGLTCDPVGGLVQIPCIERNAMGAVKAINAARLALRGDGNHRVPLDTVIATMRQTGADMKTKYKETSRGGLAVNVIEC